jgi:hypothetical protein
MIIFSGAGLIIGLAIVVGFGLGQFFTGGFDDGAAKHVTTWGASLGLGIATVLNYGLYRVSLLQNGRTIIDKETGREEVLRQSHTLFFIPVRFWPAICLALSLWWGILGFIQRSSASP